MNAYSNILNAGTTAVPPDATIPPTSALDKYDPFVIQPILFSVIIVFIVLSAIAIYYYFSIRKLSEHQAPKGLALFIFSMIEYLKQLVLEILGPKFIKMTPYFIYLFSYIILSNIISIFGFENPTASVTITLSMGMVTFIGTFVVAIRFQRWSFLRQFVLSVKIKNKSIPVMLNPLEIIGKITPLISISMRLWGNIFAGALIATLWLVIPVGAAGIPADQVINGGHPIMLVMGIFMPPLYIYLDLLTGIVQAFVFVLLTMVYWKMEAQHGEEHQSINEKPNLIAISKV